MCVWCGVCLCMCSVCVCVCIILSAARVWERGRSGGAVSHRLCYTYVYRVFRISSSGVFGNRDHVDEIAVALSEVCIGGRGILVICKTTRSDDVPMQFIFLQPYFCEITIILVPERNELLLFF